MAYTKFHTSWAVTDELSGAAFNWIETQWVLAKADADLHEHNSRYYTKTSADATFFALTTSVALGMDADKIDGSHFSDLVSSVMPVGSIMVWSGTDGTVPSGWHICDGGTYGGYGTPDLRDRFVIGGGGPFVVGSTGGPATYNGTITPTGSVTIGNHQLSTAEIPSHVHSYTEYYGRKIGNTTAYGGYVWDVGSSTASINNQDEGGDGAHGHTGSTASFTGIDPRPLYYSLYYIMKYA